MANLKIDKEKADKFIRDFIEGLKVSETKRKEIFSNTNYLKWLV